MKRIYLSLIIICATVISLAGLTFAYFSSVKVTMTNITLATGTPTIQISLDSSTYASSVDASSQSESNMYPGWTGKERSFWIKNTNTTGMQIAQVVPQVSATDPTGNWATLKSAVQARFKDTGTNGTWTEYKTLAQWQSNTTVGMVTGGNLGGNTAREFKIQYRIPEGDVSANAGETISGLIWEFVGRTP